METLESVRELVTLETVTSITEIENADLIASAKVRGWNLVVKKDEVKVGDKVVYFEIDSHLPLADRRFAFLEPRGSKIVNGVNGHVLKSARMRGVYSQGLAMPATLFPELESLAAGEDLATVLGVTKYEEEIPEEMAGTASGAFPTRFAPKTGAERVQNLTGVYADLRASYDWFATEKIDGTSTTFVNDGGAPAGRRPRMGVLRPGQPGRSHLAVERLRPSTKFWNASPSGSQFRVSSTAPAFSPKTL